MFRPVAVLYGTEARSRSRGRAHSSCTPNVDGHRLFLAKSRSFAMRRPKQHPRPNLSRTLGTLALALALALVPIGCDSGGGGGGPMENSPPSAKSDSYPAATNAKLSRDSPGLLENDTDPNGDDLTVNPTPVSGPSNGSLTLESDGSFEYTSADGFSGDDSFTYEVSDGNGETDQATVTITVRDVTYAADIEPITESSCGGAQCHIQSSESGVNLSSRDNILNSVGSQYGTEIVTPGDASRAASPMADKILPNPSRGQRMPLNQTPLTQRQITTIRAWIESLAPSQ